MPEHLYPDVLPLSSCQPKQNPKRPSTTINSGYCEGRDHKWQLLGCCGVDSQIGLELTLSPESRLYFFLSSGAPQVRPAGDRTGGGTWREIEFYFVFAFTHTIMPWTQQTHGWIIMVGCLPYVPGPCEQTECVCPLCTKGTWSSELICTVK